MFEALEIRFSFLLRATRQNLTGKSPIVFRISFRGERRDIFTGLYCSAEEWDSNSGYLLKMAKEASMINKNIEAIKRKANYVFDELRFSGEPFSIDEMV